MAEEKQEARPVASLIVFLGYESHVSNVVSASPDPRALTRAAAASAVKIVRRFGRPKWALVTVVSLDSGDADYYYVDVERQRVTASRRDLIPSAFAFLWALLNSHGGGAE